MTATEERPFLVSSLPPPRGGPAIRAAVAADLEHSRAKVLVLDDDPTGSQSVASIPLLLRFEADDIAWALADPAPVMFALTNTRALDERAAVAVTGETVAAIASEARRRGIGLRLVSRSDSTLRGHFPAEVDAAAEGLGEAGRPDAVLLCPAFPEAGRRTVDAVHFVDLDGIPTPVAETEFARDPLFGVATSDLRAWVAHRTGTIAADVGHLAVRALRAHGAPYAERMLCDPDLAQVVVLDAAAAGDLEELTLGIARAEGRGRRFVVRSGPSFVAARIGRAIPPPLISLPRDSGNGLMVVGSHTALTTRQLQRAAARHALSVLELPVDEVGGGGLTARRAAERCAGEVDRALAEGPVALATTRAERRANGHTTVVEFKRRIADALVTVVRQVVSARRPAYIVGKGGITSHDMASRALGAGRVRVLGPVFEGRVSLWHLEDGAPGLPFIVFPGNVGGDDALADCLDRIEGRGSC